MKREKKRKKSKKEGIRDKYGKKQNEDEEAARFMAEGRETRTTRRGFETWSSTEQLKLTYWVSTGKDDKLTSAWVQEKTRKGILKNRKMTLGRSPSWMIPNPANRIEIDMFKRKGRLFRSHACDLLLCIVYMRERERERKRECHFLRLETNNIHASLL